MASGADIVGHPAILRLGNLSVQHSTRQLPIRLLRWYRQHGRRALPWRQHTDPYRVWVSEIMLQQTRLETVLPYYKQFIRHFPTLECLATADLDEVLYLWSGLGYYARARNLYKTARILVSEYGARLPDNLHDLMTLPGVGRSTAGAILSLGYDIPAAILDGNVRRVLSRYHAIIDSPGQLWALAESHLPRIRAADYSQAIMDLGAMVCTKYAPRCLDCPLKKDCLARQYDIVAELPAPRPARQLPLRHKRFLLIRNPAGRVYLERHPPTGVWGGLWGPPECPEGHEPANWASRLLGLPVWQTGCLPKFTHAFSHFKLCIEPILLAADTTTATRIAEDRACWLAAVPNRRMGMPAPVSRLFAIISRMDQEGSDK